MLEKKKMSYLLLAISTTLLITLVALRDKLIVHYGIKTTRAIQMALCVFTIIAIIMNMNLILNDIKKRRRMKRIMESNKPKEEPKDPILSVRNKLDTKNLSRMMNEQIIGDWGQFSSYGKKIIDQLKEMDSYQAKLNKVLKNNDASSLSDTENILDSVEQYIANNTRKVLNYMSVSETKDDDAVKLVEKKLKFCIEDNAEQLKQVQDFLYAITEYLNHQGDENNNIDMLNIYKDTILKSIHGGEENNA